MPRAILVEIIQGNPQLAKDGSRLKSMLADRCTKSEEKKYVHAILTAQSHIVPEMMGSHKLESADIMLPRLTHVLSDCTGLQDDLAVWTVSAWAAALGIVQDWQPPPEFNTQVVGGKLPPLLTEQEEIDKFCAAFGNDIKTVDQDGLTLLHKAAGTNMVGVVKFLVSKGLDINARSFVRMTPLHFAAYTGNIEIVEFLISEGAKVNVETKDGDTPLHTAVREGHVEVVKVLAGMENVNVNAKNLNSKEEKGLTPLHLAAHAGNLELVELLVSCREDVVVNATNNTGETPLHAAVRGGSVEVARYLVGLENVNVDAKENNGLTPLHLATHFGNVDIARVLVSGMANINANANSFLNRVTPLDVAKTTGNAAMIQYLSDISAGSAVTLDKIPDKDLNQIENAIRSVENTIFDGPFSANKIEENLRLIEFSENLKTMQNRNIRALHNSGLRDTAVSVFSEAGMQALASKVATGQQSLPNSVSLSKKKADYNATLDEMDEVILPLKDTLAALNEKNSRVSSLLARCEKCKQEVSNIRDIIRKF